MDTTEETIFPPKSQNWNERNVCAGNFLNCTNRRQPTWLKATVISKAPWQILQQNVKYTAFLKVQTSHMHTPEVLIKRNSLAVSWHNHGNHHWETRCILHSEGHVWHYTSRPPMITPALCVNVLLELSLIKIKGSAALIVTRREGRSLIRGHGGGPVANT